MEVGSTVVVANHNEGIIIMIHFNSAAKTLSLVIMGTVFLAGTALGATLGFTPDNPVFAGEDLQTIQVLVEDVEDLLGASLTIEFDPAVVSPVGVSLGGLMADGSCGAFFQWVNASDFTNTIELDAAMLGCTVGGSGVLFDITFEGVATGTSELVVLEEDLRDSINDPIEFTSSNGSLSYVAEVTGDIRFEPDNVLFEEDSTCEICIDLEGVTDFMGLSVEFQFDPSVIWPLAVFSGDTLDDTGCPYFLDWINTGSVVDTVEIDLALLGCSADVDGPMICLTFQGVAFGESPLTWLDVLVRDSENNSILVNWHDGMVSYNSAVDVVPVNFGELKSIYR